MARRSAISCGSSTVQTYTSSPASCTARTSASSTCLTGCQSTEASASSMHRAVVRRRRMVEDVEQRLVVARGQRLHLDERRHVGVDGTQRLLERGDRLAVGEGMATHFLE